MSNERAAKTETQLTPEQVFQAGAELIEHFGIATRPDKDPEQFIEAINQLNPRFQGGRNLVRWELEQDQTDWPEETKDVIMRAAESMRMLEKETPLMGDFDLVVVLGGARRANFDRLDYVAQAVNLENATADQTVIAGSNRKLNDGEIEAVKSFAPSAKTEFDLCVYAGMEVEMDNPSLFVKYVKIEDERAGTPDVIREVIQRGKKNGTLDGCSNIAAVTTQIYQASTELDLARVAKEFGITQTFTAGNPSDPKIVEARTPATYLSEVIRTLKAATLAAQSEQ